jgi:hypothetical protein
MLEKSRVHSILIPRHTPSTTQFLRIAAIVRPSLSLLPSSSHKPSIGAPSGGLVRMQGATAGDRRALAGQGRDLVAAAADRYHPLRAGSQALNVDPRLPLSATGVHSTQSGKVEDCYGAFGGRGDSPSQFGNVSDRPSRCLRFASVPCKAG